MNKKEKYYSDGYDYTSIQPIFIDRDKIQPKHWQLLTESKTFCMMPWVHMHAFPDGRAYPCCLSDYWHPMGDLRKNTMEEV